jgi:hypothetical protein
MKPLAPILIFFITIISLCTAANAHETWLVPGSAGVQAEPAAGHKKIALALTTGMAFPALGTSTAPARILRANLISADASVPLLVGNSSTEKLELSGLTKSKSAVMAIVQLKPSVIDLPKDKVGEYLIELGNPASVKARFEASGTWRESYTKNAKMWVRVGSAAAPKSLMAPMNLPYELVPASDPTVMKVGERLKVCAFADGKAAPNAYLGLVDAFGQHSHTRADKTGCANFKLPSTSGFLLHAIRIGASSQTDLDWESHFASLTVLDISKPASIAR